MTLPAGGAHGGMLTSWKAIARFFDRDVRTVQRWEKQEGLPVHRHPHQRQSSVYAYVSELETWWRERGQGLGGQAVAADDASGVAAAEVAGPSSGAVVPPSASGVPVWKVAAWLLVAGALTAVAIVLTPWNDASRTTARATPPDPRVVAVFDGPRPDSDLQPGPVADLNGDGHDDFVFFIPADHAIFVVFGEVGAGGPLDQSAQVVIRGRDNGAHYVNAAQDVDGDGLPDLVVSVLLFEPDALTRTAPTYLLRGRREWPQTITLPDDADVTFASAFNADIRLQACTSTHFIDLNRDGIGDLVLGATEYNPGGRPSAGSAFILFGRRTWPRRVDFERDADVTILGERSGEGLSANCDAGDFNGDDYPDLALIASEGTLWNLLGSRGRYYLFLGRDRWPARLEAVDADLRVEGLRPDASLWRPLLADLTGDGLDDLVLSSTHTAGEPGEGAELAIFLGRREIGAGVQPMSAADVLVQHPQAAARLGASLLALDLDLDGVEDLMVSEPGHGRLHLLRGRTAWPSHAGFDTLAPLEIFTGWPGVGLGGLSSGWIRTAGGPVQAVAAANAGQARLIRTHLPLAIDVRPGFENNILYLPGLLVVRIDGRQMSDDPIDPGTVRVAGVAPGEFVWRDFDGDGIPDLQLHFDTPRMTVSPDTTTVRLTARTVRGRLLAGSDSVVVLPGDPN